jgi:hypothetical protein
VQATDYPGGHSRRKILLVLRRALRTIGQHPVAGVWVLVQGLLLIGIAYELRSVSHVSGLEDIGPALGLALVFMLQLPASLVTLGITRMVTLWVDLDPRMFHSLVIGQSVVAGVANAVFWSYTIPKIGDYVESRWPFERGHRRRLQTLHSHR